MSSLTKRPWRSRLHDNGVTFDRRLLFGPPPPQQPEKEETRPPGLTGVLAIGTVTETAVSDTKLGGARQTGQRQLIGFLKLRHLVQPMPRFTWLVPGFTHPFIMPEIGANRRPDVGRLLVRWRPWVVPPQPTAAPRSAYGYGRSARGPGGSKGQADPSSVASDLDTST
jgi:hypothetical protein